MPVEGCKSEGKPGYRWGKEGKCYTYESGDESGRRKAKQRAIIQGEAIQKSIDVSVDLMPLEKIKVDEINANTVSKMDRLELLGMHFRLHELWGTHNRENSMEYRYVEPHTFIVQEMVKRGYEHKSVDLLDQLTGIFNQSEMDEDFNERFQLEIEGLMKLRSRPLEPIDLDFIVPKAKNRITSNADKFSPENLDKHIVEFEHHGFYVEPLMNGLRTVIQKRDDQLSITFEDSGIDRIPQLIEFDERIKGFTQLPDCILDGDLSVIENGRRWSRPQTIRMIQNGISPTGIELVYTVNDILYWAGESFNDKPFRLRRELIEEAAEQLQSVGMKVVPAARANSASSLASSWEHERYGKREGSDGIVIKSSGWFYGIGGRHTPYVIEIKRTMIVVAEVLELRNREGTYDFRAGLKSSGKFSNTVEIEGKTYLDLGWSYNSPFGAKPGEVVEVKVEEIVVDETENTMMWMNAIPVSIASTQPSSDEEVYHKAVQARVLGLIPKGFDAHFEKSVWIAKSDEERRYTLGVVYPHSEYDSYGHWTDQSEIEKMAWLYMQESPMIGLMHEDGTEYSGQVVESYLYRGPDWHVNGQVVREGDWLIGVIWSPEAWELVKLGIIRGYSLQGWGKSIIAEVQQA
jgi:hypothetical protein